MKRELPNNEDELTKVPGEFSAQEAARQLGRRGGKSTLERRGTEFFREIGAKGGRKTAELYADLLAEFGRKGGRPRRPVLNKPEGEQDRQ